MSYDNFCRNHELVARSLGLSAIMPLWQPHAIVWFRRFARKVSHTGYTQANAEFHFWCHINCTAMYESVRTGIWLFEKETDAEAFEQAWKNHKGTFNYEFGLPKPTYGAVRLADPTVDAAYVLRQTIHDWIVTNIPADRYNILNNQGKVLFRDKADAALFKLFWER